MKIKTQMISRVLAVLLFFGSVGLTINSFAAGQKAFSVNELVDQFYAKKTALQNAKKLFAGQMNHRPPMDDCHPQGPSCLDAACARLGAFGCDDINEVQDVGRACRGNYDGTCLNAVCDKLGAFGCDDHPEIQAVARACVGNYDVDCFNSVCARLGDFGCDDLSEAVEVLRTCAGN